jgi:hypothetical protein
MRSSVMIMTDAGRSRRKFLKSVVYGGLVVGGGIAGGVIYSWLTSPREPPQNQNLQNPSTSLVNCFTKSFVDMKIDLEQNAYDPFMTQLSGMSQNSFSLDNAIAELGRLDKNVYRAFRGDSADTKKPILELMSQVHLQDENWTTAYEHIALNSVAVRALGTRHYEASFNPNQAEYGVWLFDEANLSHILYSGNFVRKVKK